MTPGQTLLIDAHGTPITGPSPALYRYVIARTGPVATLIEWDNDVPDWSWTLRAEADTAEQLILAAAGRASAA